MTHGQRKNEMLIDLAAAVMRGDLAAAQAQLDLIGQIESADSFVAQARRRVRPLDSGAELATPQIMPVPGHAPGSFEGSPLLVESA